MEFEEQRVGGSSPEVLNDMLLVMTSMQKTSRITHAEYFYHMTKRFKLTEYFSNWVSLRRISGIDLMTQEPYLCIDAVFILDPYL